jgi:5-hydroxyisourate hydrolase-like protein (transthyretin family)
MTMKNLFLLSILAVILVLSACRRNTDCTANIICNDAQGKPLNGVEVRLFATVGANPKKIADVKANGVTDKDGKVSFIFKLPAIFDVNAAVGTTTASTIIKLEEGKTSEKVIELK